MVKVLRDTGCTGMIVDRALVPDVMVIPGSSGLLQMVDHTLIDCALACVFGFPILQRTLQVDVCELHRLPSDYWKRAISTTDVARPRLEG